MKIKKVFLAISISLFSSLLVFSEGSDVIVLLDSSGTSMPWFEQINGQILTEITKKFLRKEDTFHLISFNSKPNLEIVQPIYTESDISRIVSRFMLLYPLGLYSDFLSGMQYTLQYTSSLNQSKPKEIIIISDGIFNPPLTSLYANYSAEQINFEISQISKKIKSSGWNVYYIKLPYPKNSIIFNPDGSVFTETDKNTANEDAINIANAPNKMQGSIIQGKTTPHNNEEQTVQDVAQTHYTDISQSFVESVGIQVDHFEESTKSTFIESVFSIPQVQFPSKLGKKGYTFSIPLKIKNPSSNILYLELTGVYFNSLNLLNSSNFVIINSNKIKTIRPSITLPATLPLGDTALPIRLVFSGSQRVNPDSTTITFTLVPFSLESFILTKGNSFFVFIILLVGILALILLILFILHQSTKKAYKAIAETKEEINISTEKQQVLQSRTQQKSSFKTSTFQTASTITDISQNSFLENKALTSQNNKKENADILGQFKHTQKSDYYNLPQVIAPEKSSASTSVNIINSKEKSYFKQQQAHRAQDLEYSSAHNTDKIASIKIRNKIPQIKTTPVEVRAHARLMLKLTVFNQNPHIGKRNVHLLKEGSRLSIGGGISSFLVFLVKFPNNIAEVRWDGLQCNMAILKPQYFPYEKEMIIQDCIGKVFTLVSDKNYEVSFVFEQYEDPLIALNNLLRSIEYKE